MNEIAETRQGKVQGKLKNDVLLFAGIPYAAPPVGERRFKAPAAHAPWAEVRSTTKFGKPAPQLATGGMTSAVPVDWDEDCLFLNVQTPALDDGNRPVLVWIHGGGFRTGQGAIPWYDGASSCETVISSLLALTTVWGRLALQIFLDLAPNTRHRAQTVSLTRCSRLNG